MMEERRIISDLDFSTPANPKSVKNLNFLNDFLLPPPAVASSSSAVNGLSFNNNNIVLRMDQQLREQREFAVIQSHDDSHMHHHPTSSVLPDIWETGLTLRPLQVPFEEDLTSCPLCAGQAMHTPPSNGRSHPTCECQRRKANSTFPHWDLRREHSFSRKFDSQDTSSMMDLVIDPDWEDWEQPRHIALKPKRSKSESPTRSASFDDWTDETDFMAASRSPRVNALLSLPPRRRRRASGGNSRSILSPPTFPLMSPENSRACIDISSDDPMRLSLDYMTPRMEGKQEGFEDYETPL